LTLSINLGYNPRNEPTKGGDKMTNGTTTKPKATKRPELTPEQKAERQAERRANFVRLANARANRLSKGIASLGKLSGPGYVYNESDVAAIFGALYDDLRAAEAQFTKGTPTERVFVS
jgi:hypothetical protein